MNRPHKKNVHSVGNIFRKSALIVRNSAEWLWRHIKANWIVLGIVSLVWLIIRTGRKPTRIVYPCQKAAATHASAFLAGLVAPVVSRCKKSNRRNLLTKLIVAGIAIITMIGVIELGAIISDANKGKTNAFLPHHYLADESSYDGAVLPERQLLINPEDAIVSIARGKVAGYGTTSPYDPEDNPAYQVVWDAVVNLHLGTPDNPLRDLIKPGEKVLIKPNLVIPAPLTHTDPAVVRPLIDMAIKAGAGEICVADGPSPVGARDFLVREGYQEMVNTLAKRHPDATIITANLLDQSDFSWVNLGKDCAFENTDYTDEDMDKAHTSTSEEFFNTTDSHGVNPHGAVRGWVAINDRVLDADVIINVPKLKIHTYVNTMAVKNFVGVVLTTKPVRGERWGRVSHWKQDSSDYDKIFGNDVFWREILNIQRACLYWKDGVLYDEPQRKYLCVLDGIIGGKTNLFNPEPVNVGAVLASVDPVALDVVASRLMGYDFRIIVYLNNVGGWQEHSIGTSDPARIRIVGSDIDQSINHVFEFFKPFGDFEDYKTVPITDFEPPVIKSTDMQPDGTGVTFKANINGAVVAYLYYKTNQEDELHAARMARDGSTFTYTLDSKPLTSYIVAQDEHFNTKTSSAITITPVNTADAGSGVLQRSALSVAN